MSSSRMITPISRNPSQDNRLYICISVCVIIIHSLLKRWAGISHWSHTQLFSPRASRAFLPARVATLHGACAARSGETMMCALSIYPAWPSQWCAVNIYSCGQSMEIELRFRVGRSFIFFWILMRVYA